MITEYTKRSKTDSAFKVLIVSKEVQKHKGNYYAAEKNLEKKYAYSVRESLHKQAK